MKKLYGLNYLRIALMLWVLLFHNRMHYQFAIGWAEADFLISIGAIGCTGFFIISGFVLRYNYGDKLCREGETKRYVFNRISSVYPIYLFMMAVALITGYGVVPSRRQTLLVLPFNLALLQTFDHEKFYGLFYNNNCWYIATAFVLYMLFPVLNRILNSLKLNKLKWLGLAFLFCVGCSEYLYLLNIHAPISNTFLSYYAHPLYRIPEFVSGMLLCDIHRITSQKWKGGVLCEPCCSAAQSEPSEGCCWCAGFSAVTTIYTI